MNEPNINPTINSDILIKQFKKRNINAYFVQNKEDALELIFSLLKKGSTVTWGGSSTLKEIGLIEKLKTTPNIKVIDRSAASTPEEKEQIMHEAFFSDYYFSSCNAISSDGLIVNIDGIGNRVAAISYGPKNVILIVGVNKVTATLKDAVSRARNVAAPKNAHRFDVNTPCKITNTCENCHNESICSFISIIRGNTVPNRIKIIIINEELGY